MYTQCSWNKYIFYFYLFNAAFNISKLEIFFITPPPPPSPNRIYLRPTIQHPDAYTINTTKEIIYNIIMSRVSHILKYSVAHQASDSRISLAHENIYSSENVSSWNQFLFLTETINSFKFSQYWCAVCWSLLQMSSCLWKNIIKKGLKRHFAFGNSVCPMDNQDINFYSWLTHWAISCSSQCSTTGVTKAVVCAILPVGCCI